MQAAVLVGGVAPGKRMVSIGVANHGSTSVAFSGGSTAVRVKGAKNLFVIPRPVGQQLPYTLNHGTSMTLLADLAALKEAVREQYGDVNAVKIRAEVKDQLALTSASGYASW